MFKKIVEQIERFDSIVLFGHSHPDGDCYGSQIALRELIKSRYPNKRVYAVGSGMPEFFSSMAKMDIVSDDIIKESLAIILDANDLSRIEDKRVYDAKAYAKIDHHVDVHSFTEGPEVIVEDANSTCELIVDLAFRENFEINKIAAKGLFLGILTDTARFQYCVDFAKVFEICKYLINKGADPYSMYQILNARDESYLQLVGYVYSHYQKTKAGTLYMIFDREDIEKLGGKDSIEIANQVRLLGNVKGYGVWVFFVERSDGRLSAEFRSNKYNVQSVASRHGGGGHTHAAGMTVPKFDREFIKEVLNECDELIQKEIM